MRPLLHLFSIVLVLPSVLLASAFILLGRAIAARSLPGLLMQLLTDALWLVPWGILGACAVVLLLALGGFSVRTRWLAGAAVALLGILSIAIALAFTMGQANFTPGQLWFFVPAVVASGIGLWFAVAERRRDGLLVTPAAAADVNSTRGR